MSDPGPESRCATVRSMFANARPLDRWLMGVGFVGATCNGISFPILITIMGKTMNNLGNQNSLNFNQAVNQNSLNFIYLAACTFVACFLEGYCWTRTAERQASRMRMQYLRAVLRQDISFFDLNFASMNEIITSVSSDSFVIQEVLSEKVPSYIMNCSNFIGSYMAAFILLWQLAAKALPTVVLLLIPGLIYGWVSLDLGRKIHMEYDKAGVVAEQAFSAIRTVYSSVAERRTMVAFSAALEGSMRLGFRQGLAKGLALGSNGVSFSIWALMAWYGSRLVIYQGAQGGTVYAVGTCIIFGGLAFGSSLSNLKYFGEALAAAQRIKKVIDRQPTIDSASEEGEELGQVKGEVEFSKVRFAYPARPEAEVFESFSLRVEAGKTVALVGGSGSGKSTAIALLQRFYDPSGGQIFLDGVDIRKLRLKWLRAQMGLVSQEPALFATTIKENVLFSKEDATMEEVVAAAKAANAHEFITQLPLGYNTQVGERGVQMSGGQKQRIAIARAIIRAPKILLLDEATSALDSESERIVQEALDAATIGCTTIVIAHRLSTIRNADTIAFIDAGQVTESGSHDQLINNPAGSYTALFCLQESLLPDMNNNSASGELSRSTSSKCPSLTKTSSARSAGEAGGENDRHMQGVPTKPLAPSFRRLLMMNAPEWRQAIVGCGAALMFGGVQPIYAYFMGSMIMAYFLKDPEELTVEARTHALIFVGLTILSFVVNVLQHYNLGVMGERLTRRVRERMVSKVLTFEVAWFDRAENSTGALCSRLAKDTTVVRSLVGDRMSLLIQTLGAVILAWTMGLIIAWPLALVMIVVQPMLIACFYARRILLTALSRKAIKAQSESSKLAAEAVENLRTVTAFSSQDRILYLFGVAQAGTRRQSIRQSWLAGVGIACSYSVTIFSWALSMWYGGHLVSQHNITSKALIQTFMIVATTGRVIADASSTTTDLAKGITSVASIFDFLDRSPSIDPEDPQGHHAETITGAVELRNVDFSYPARADVTVLKCFSLSIEAGQSTALVGSSGSGKSTIISLIERFYDPLCGVVLVDGRDIRSYNLRSLRQHISLVAQEPTLFAGTVRENITYGVEKASNMEIEAAARAANAHEFISVLKDGYETLCGERGVQLSGGQKQRVAIARAILRNPSVLLLDEATSALDGQSEKLVQEALERMMVGRTSVVVAHRLSTIRNCNVIAVLKKGVMAEKGNHESLMSIGPEGIYYGLVLLQQAHI